MAAAEAPSELKWELQQTAAETAAAWQVRNRDRAPLARAGTGRRSSPLSRRSTASYAHVARWLGWACIQITVR